jgi:Putative zinc-finger
MQCRDFREMADSYLSDELLVETNHDVIVHLETCADCRRELAARREVRTNLRASFAKAEELQMPDEFSSRLQNELRAAATSGAMGLNIRRRQWMIAAGLVLAVTFGAIAVWQRQRAQTNSEMAEKRQPQNTGAVKPLDVGPHPPDIAVDANAILPRMSELAAGDHRDCAIGHRLPDMPIALEEAARKYDRAYLDLTKTVMSNRDDFDELIELVMAHACLFKGHWFGHIVVRYRGRLISLLVTRLEDSSGIATTKVPKDLEAQVIACSTVAGYQISCFRTEHHGVFVVSDLEEGENLALARKLAPSVYEHITQAEHIG